MDEFFKIISQFGFPIALSVYLLIRFEKILEDLRAVVANLADKVDDMTKEIVRWNQENAAIKDLIEKNSQEILKNRQLLKKKEKK